MLPVDGAPPPYSKTVSELLFLKLMVCHCCSNFLFCQEGSVCVSPICLYLPLARFLIDACFEKASFSNF